MSEAVTTIETQIAPEERDRLRRVENEAYVLVAAMRTAEKMPTEPARHHVDFQVGRLADALGVPSTVAADRVHFRATEETPTPASVLESERVADMDAAVASFIARWDRLVREESAIREEPAANLRVLSELRGAVEALREASAPFSEDDDDLAVADGDVTQGTEDAEPTWLSDLKREKAAV